jgi:hypothetical protein
MLRDLREESSSPFRGWNSGANWFSSVAGDFESKITDLAKHKSELIKHGELAQEGVLAHESGLEPQARLHSLHTYINDILYCSHRWLFNQAITTDQGRHTRSAYFVQPS